MKRQNRGFTLVELLVVIAIMGVVAALLLPAIAGARERAIGASCVSNLRQHGIAFELYADEHNNEIPTVDQLVNYLDDTDVFICPRDPRSEGEFGEFETSYTTHPGTPTSTLPSAFEGAYSEQVTLVESSKAGIKTPQQITIDDVDIKHGPFSYALHLDGHVRGYTDTAQIAEVVQPGPRTRVPAGE